MAGDFRHPTGQPGDRLWLYQAGRHAVDAFVEKPDAARAEAMLAEGGYAWNAGIFAFRADAYLGALERFQPDMLRAVRTCMDKAQRQDNIIRPDPDCFADSPSDSIDYAVMERAEKVACVPVTMGWSDVGSWDSLHDISVKDDNGNVLQGDVLALGTKGCLVHSDGPRIALVDVDDLIVVATHGVLGSAGLVKYWRRQTPRRSTCSVPAVRRLQLRPLATAH